MVSPLCGALTAALSSLLLPLFFSIPQAQAAPDIPIQMTLPQASSFTSAFTTLAQQAHVMIVAEDQPLHLALTPQALARLRLNKDGEPLSTLLPKLAAAYDYDVQPSGKVFLLKKRYTDAADLPSVTVKECALGMEEASRYAENFNPHFPDDGINDSPAMKDLIYSLTPEQLQAMGDRKQGVPVASLTPVQQQDVQQFVLHFYVQRAVMDLPAAVCAVNQVASGNTKFGWHFFPLMNARLFGYDALYFGHMTFLPLSKPNQVKCDVAYASMQITPQTVEGEPVTTPQTAMQLTSSPDLTDPLPAPFNAPGPAPPVSSSLAEIIARLNARAADGLKVTVEPYLAPKQVTVFGENCVTPKQELDALAELYGLRVFTEEKQGGKDRLRLTRQTARVPLDVVALHDSILQALPGPLVRAYNLHNDFVPPDPASLIPFGLSAPRMYAVRQIRTAAEPKLRVARDKDGRVALSALSEREGRAFAVLLILDVMHSLGIWVRATPPDQIIRFNDLCLGGGLSEKDGKKQMDLILELPRPGAPFVLEPGPGVGGINYDPVNHTF